MVRLKIDKILEERNISRYELSKRSGIQYQVIDNYYKNRAKRYDRDILYRICIALDCDISDIIELVKE